MGEYSRRIRRRAGNIPDALTRREFIAAAGLACAAACADRQPISSVKGTSWGASGTRDGEFRRPRAIAATPDEVFVIDTSGRMQVFSQAGDFLRGWLMPEYENGTPTGISFSHDGRLLIPDTHYNGILEYTPEGEILREWGSYGTGKDQFIYPTDIVQGPDGGYFISEYGTGAERVHVFDADRRFVRQWGEHGDQPGQFSRAMSIALHNGVVFVCDTANHRVQCFTSEGALLRVIGGPGAEPGRFKFPHDLAIGPGDTLFVCEYGNNRVSRFTCEGEFQRCFGEPGRGSGQFSAPRGVAVSPNGFLFVADTDNDRIQRFSLEDLV